MQALGYIGQFISGVAFVATATVACLTYFVYHRKQLEEQSRKLDDEWLDRFRDLYREFWNNDEVQKARHYVNNDEGYREIEPILIKRNSMEFCDVTWKEYEILERIDKFCAILARVRSFALSISMTPVQEELWGDLLYNFWIKRLRDRSELRIYVTRHWTKIDQDITPLRRKAYIRR